MKRVCLLLVVFVASLAHAQTEPPLVGPLVALNTPQQDRIVLYDVGGQQQRVLRFGPRWHYVWDFSPDGCRVLFTLSEGTSPPRLYSARLDGSEMRPLVRYDQLPAEQWGVWHAQWSPGGNLIAFTMQRDRPNRDGVLEREYHLAVIDATGGEPDFYSVTGREHTPVWSPDGAWLAYLSYQQRVPGADIFSTAAPTPEPPPGQPVPEPTLLNEADLWVVSADGETKYNLTSFPTGSVRLPRWSPDGELISFVYSPSPNNDTLWMIGNTPDAIPTQLSFDWSLALDTTWLPDSSAMLAALRDFQETTANRLWQIPLVGNADETATPYVDDPALEHADYPRFSAGGRWLAFRSAYRLVLMRTETREWTLHDDILPGNTPPVWSPAAFEGEAACRAQ